MAMDSRSPGLAPVANDDVWRLTRLVFIGAALLFLVNIALGFVNAVTPGSLPRWQLLTHLHAGTIGWITLSLVGIAIWLFTGGRQVSPAYVTWVRRLGLGAVLLFAAYIASFGIAFSQGLFVLLPLFGGLSVLVLWGAAGFAARELTRLPVVSNIHVLIAGGLVVAAVGGTMGFLLGLEYVVGWILPFTGPNRISIHTAMMDTYLFLVAAGIVEWFVLGDDAGRWTYAGVAQALAGTIAAVIVPVAFLLDLVEVLLPVFALMVLLFLALFVARMGWRALYANPLETGYRAWGFFGAAWFVLFVLSFLYVVVVLQGDVMVTPEWFLVAFAHIGFIGMMTNLLLGVYSARTAGLPDRYGWAEPAALWGLNGGLLVFLAVRIPTGRPDGAVLMGLGVLLGVLVMLDRLRSE